MAVMHTIQKKGKKKKKKGWAHTILRKGNRTKAAYNEQMARATEAVRFSRVASLTDAVHCQLGDVKKYRSCFSFIQEKVKKIHNQKDIWYRKITHKIRTGSNSAQQNTRSLFNGKPFCWGILFLFVFSLLFLFRLPNGNLGKSLGTLLWKGPSEVGALFFLYCCCFVSVFKQVWPWGSRREPAVKGAAQGPEADVQKILLTLYN